MGCVCDHGTTEDGPILVGQGHPLSAIRLKDPSADNLDRFQQQLDTKQLSSVR